MSESDAVRSREAKIEAALDALEKIGGKLRKPGHTEQELAEAAEQLKALRGVRAYPEMAAAAEAVRRHAPSDVLISTLQAQALIEEGRCTAAADLMEQAIERATPGSKGWQEAFGLLGRAYKQIYMDEEEKASEGAQEALRRSLAAYQTAFSADPKENYWHGGNVAALLFQAEDVGAEDAQDRAEVAARLVEGLEAVPEAKRDHWWRATYAEAELARDDYDACAAQITAFLNAHPDAHALNSFQRQLGALWGFADERFGPESRMALEMIRARLLKADGVDGNPSSPVVVPAEQVAAKAMLSGAEAHQAQRTFGDASPQELIWWRMGNVRARSVGAVLKSATGGSWSRHGTGFLVPVIEADGSKSMGFLTNAHVVGDLQARGLAPDQARVRFEAHAKKIYEVDLLWSSPFRQFDATLLRVRSLARVLEPLPLSSKLPDRTSEARLYIIGHPLGQELSFSFQDNKFLDWADVDDRHDNHSVTLVHYRTPTEKGSSGSPVFQELEWRAIALHHAGHHHMSQLHAGGVYEANEGIGLASISKALHAATGLKLQFEES